MFLFLSAYSTIYLPALLLRHTTLLRYSLVLFSFQRAYTYLQHHEV